MLDDEKLIKKYIDWDKKSLEKLLGKHLQGIFNMCYRYSLNEDDSNDITQEVCIKIVKNLSKFKFKSSFKTWVYRITYNETINYLKKNKQNLSFEEESYKIESINTPEKELEKKEIYKIITKEINKLDETSRNIILMYYYDDLKIKEISQIIWINENTIKTKLKRAKQFLKPKIEKLWEK